MWTPICHKPQIENNQNRCYLYIFVGETVCSETAFGFCWWRKSHFRQDSLSYRCTIKNEISHFSHTLSFLMCVLSLAKPQLTWGDIFQHSFSVECLGLWEPLGSHGSWSGITVCNPSGVVWAHTPAISRHTEDQGEECGTSDGYREWLGFGVEAGEVSGKPWWAQQGVQSGSQAPSGERSRLPGDPTRQQSPGAQQAGQGPSRHTASDNICSYASLTISVITMYLKSHSQYFIFAWDRLK